MVEVRPIGEFRSIAPPNMFETMRFTWNMGIPWRGTPSEPLPDVSCTI